MAIDPSESGRIFNFDLSDISIYSGTIKTEVKKINDETHLQGIAQAGQYTVLSSSGKKMALILAHKKKIVQVESLPNDYEHAGGIAVLEPKNGENGKNRWMIVVPVYKGDKGAILRYFLSEEQGNQARLQGPKKIKLLSKKAYAAGIARNGNSVVIAVVVDSDGNKVQFFKCDDSDGQGNYKPLNNWDAEQAETNGWIDEKNGWIDDNWARYPNSISLIGLEEQIYFLGLNGPSLGMGEDWVDLYSVNLCRDTDNKQLIKVGKAQVECDDADINAPWPLAKIIGPSFRWGGSARNNNRIVEVLAVGCYVHNNLSIEYNKFCFTIDTNKNNQLSPCEIPSD